MLQEEEINIKKLRKKCISKFFSQREGTQKTVEEVGAKFVKKIKKILNIQQDEQEGQPLPGQSKARGFA